MSELLNAQALSFFLFFIAPGFIAMQVYDLMVASERRNFAESLVEVITFSLINFVLVYSFADPWLTPDFKAEHPFVWRIALVGVVVVAPTLEAIAFRKLRGLSFLRGAVTQPTPTGWDHFFSQGKTCFVLCSLKSGKRVGGFYGAQSLASSYPRPEQIYLQDVWTVDESGHFVEKIDGTAGTIIPMAECELMEFFWPVGGKQ